ncbi:MAG: DUF4102 domain-containing protein [Rhodospirillales bacterium]|nr:DUF4102 domain-containing protein [Rhodospirillales bacterium]
MKAVNTDTQVEELPVKKTKRYAVAVKNQPGLYVRVTPKGVKSFVAVARDPHGKQVWATLNETKIDGARDAAREAMKRIRDGLPAFEPPAPKPDAFKAVAENYLKREVRGKLRSADEIERCLKVYVYPSWEKRVFEEIRRSDVAKLLDDIEDNHKAPRQADLVLAILRKLCNWHAARVDDYVSPIVKGMARQKPSEHARERILSDDEIRAVWPLLNDTFGAAVKLMLLSGQRRAKVASMKRADVALDGTWTIPTEDREKGNAEKIKLPELALAVLRDQKEVDKNPYYFGGRGEGHINGFSRCKDALDEKLLAALKAEAEKRGEEPERVTIEDWVLHDLRRTARSLMSRARVPREVAEITLGHVIKGVEGTYDRHDYAQEKADALKLLADQVWKILNPQDATLVPTVNSNPDIVMV